ncbi:MAG: TfoX/Sxy family protein [Burkholderiaceae bacterium]
MSEFTDHLREMLAAFAPVSVRRMFGGYGVYLDDLMFALVIDDELYLKADSHNLHRFEALGLEAFSYVRNGRVTSMSYRRAPDSCLEDPREAEQWARLAYDAALRARKTAKTAKGTKGTKAGVGKAGVRRSPSAGAAAPPTRSNKRGKQS